MRSRISRIRHQNWHTPLSRELASLDVIVVTCLAKQIRLREVRDGWRDPGPTHLLWLYIPATRANSHEEVGQEDRRAEADCRLYPAHPICSNRCFNRELSEVGFRASAARFHCTLLFSRQHYRELTSKQLSLAPRTNPRVTHRALCL